MERPVPLPVGRRFFPLCALVLLLVHTVLLTAARHSSIVPLLSNLVQFAAAFLAAMASIAASRRFIGFGKQFWTLIGTGYFLWSAAQLLATYYDSIVHAALQGPWPSDIIFFVSMAPAFMALFIDPERGLEWKDWPRLLDITQIIIFTVAGFLFSFYTPTDWERGWGVWARWTWVPDSGRDLLLLVTFVVSAWLTQQRLARDLYKRVALFLFIYQLGEWPYLYLQSNSGLRTGTLWDLGWSVPFLAAAVLSATSEPLSDSMAQETVSRPQQQRRGQLGMVHLASLIFPLLVLLMAAGIAEKQLLLAVVMVLASFACSSARIIVGEKQQRLSTSALEQQSALLKSIFESTADGLYVKDSEGRYLAVNQAFCKRVGKTHDQIIGKTAAQIMDFATAKRMTEQDRIVLASEQTHTFEHEVTFGGRTSTVLFTKSPFRDSSGKIMGVVALARNITEYRAMQDRLRQSQKMEAIGTLAGGVAHDFNNILMVISGYSSVLLEQLEQPRLRGHVEQIQKSGERAAALTRQLLAFSRKQTIQPELLSLNSLVVGVEKLLHRLIGEHISTIVRLAPDLGTIKADAGQIEQVILNLAVNARDAMPEGGQLILETRNREIAPAVDAALSVVKPGYYVEMEVRDTGSGMSPEVQSRVFEPFFTTKPAGKGTGLGLSTVYGIVEQSGGHVSFESESGHGTVFRILFPRVNAPHASRSVLETTDASFRGNETILIAEDDPAVCEVVRSVLVSHGYHVLYARRPEEAEALCGSGAVQIHLLLTDVVMPGMNGADLSKRLVASNPQMKVIFMSGYIEDSVVRRGILEHEVAFLQKPFSPLGLVKKVREVLDSAKVL